MLTEIHHTIIPEEKHHDKASYSWEEKRRQQPRDRSSVTWYVTYSRTHII
jgi:hypothetical protein